jgi:hypothetical protein
MLAHRHFARADAGCAAANDYRNSVCAEALHSISYWGKQWRQRAREQRIGATAQLRRRVVGPG